MVETKAVCLILAAQESPGISATKLCLLVVGLAERPAPVAGVTFFEEQ